MAKNSVMIVGLGDLGGHVLELLARVPNMPKIVTADINEDWGVRKSNCATAGASYFGFYPDIEFVQLDAFDVDRTATTLQEFQPTIIYNAMTLQSWWVITTLPHDAHMAIDKANFGPWFPMHFMPTYRLMQAVKKSGINTHVVNSAFPDLVHPVLAKIGLAPTVGIGNTDLLVCGLRMTVARMLNVPMRSVTIYVIAPHVFSYHVVRFGNSGGIPYYLKVMIDDKDITPKINRDELLTNVVRLAKRTGGAQGHPMVASSACRIILGILFDTGESSHAPGPNGLPGGYPVKLSANGVDVFLPDTMTIEEAIRINNEAQIFEGVESIRDDGTVIITDKAANIMKTILDFDCKSYTIKDCEVKAKELSTKYKKWVSSFK